MKTISALVKTSGLLISLYGGNKYHVAGLNEISIGIIIVVISWYLLFWSSNEN